MGNPGDRYYATRHNAGFRVMDLVAEEKCANFRKPLFWKIMVARGFHGKEVFFLSKPFTFMNLSGTVLTYLLKRSKVTEDRIFVILDNMDLPPGEIRIKSGGGSAGHNGLSSIMQALPDNRFNRIYVGIGRPRDNKDIISYVLSVPEGNEAEKLRSGELKAFSAVSDLLQNPVERVMNEYNRRIPGS